MDKWSREWIESKIPKKYHHMVDFETTAEFKDGLYLIETPELKKVQTRFHIDEAPSNWSWYIKRINENPAFDW